jgi:hypothetical protein
VGNLQGHWKQGRHWSLKTGDPRDLAEEVKANLKPAGNSTYWYMSCTGDQVWSTDPNAPASLKSQCDGDELARFLLAAEPGCFFGTNGWSPDYAEPLGDPLGPAVFTPAATAAGSAATLRRNFTSGTHVIFTYDAGGKDGSGEVWWGGRPPAPAVPTPPPPAPTPPPTPPPGPPITITCGKYTSSELPGTTFGQDDVAVKLEVASAGACCEDCGADAACAQWAWHSHAKECHLHGNQAVQKGQAGTTSGVVVRGQ